MTTVRKILRDYGIRPIRSLGQSFLEDKNVINKILSVADILEDDTVVEIGAGIGIMTELLAKKAKKVIALDIDQRMTGILKERLGGYQNVDIIKTNVLEYDFSSVMPVLCARKIKVIGNIPYNISSQILFRLLAFRSHISCMILMFQKELADRLIAPPGTKEYGIPSVFVSMYTKCSRELVIPRSCFYPQPKVTSAVMKMLILDKPLSELRDHDFFSRIVKIAFAKKRKTLLNNLRSSNLSGYSEKDLAAALQNADIDGMRRAETMTAEELGRLSNVILSIEKS